MVGKKHHYHKEVAQENSMTKKMTRELKNKSEVEQEGGDQLRRRNVAGVYVGESGLDTTGFRLGSTEKYKELPGNMPILQLINSENKE